MNYIKYLADARLINMMYLVGDDFPKKPSKIMMHNSNLLYTVYPIVADEQVVMETFFVNALWKDHLVNQGNKRTVLYCRREMEISHLRCTRYRQG